MRFVTSWSSQRKRTLTASRKRGSVHGTCRLGSCEAGTYEVASAEGKKALFKLKERAAAKSSFDETGGGPDPDERGGILNTPIRKNLCGADHRCMSGYCMNRVPHNSLSPKSEAKEKEKKPWKTIFNRVCSFG